MLQALYNEVQWRGLHANLRAAYKAGPEVTMLANVFEDVLQTLGLVERKDPMTEMVAKKLVEFATSGIRDPARLKALTVQALIQQQQQQIQRTRH